MNRLKKLVSVFLVSSLVSACFPVPLPIMPIPVIEGDEDDEDGMFFPVIIPIPIPKSKPKDGGGASDTDEKKCLSSECENEFKNSDDYRQELYKERGGVE